MRGLLPNGVTWTTHSVVAIPSMQGAPVTEKGKKTEFLSIPLFVVLLMMLFLASSSVTGCTGCTVTVAVHGI